MPDTKISNLAEDTAPAVGDWVLAVDISDTSMAASGTDKKVQMQNLNLNAAKLSAGTVPTARLGSGTANATTFLRGDSTWQVASSGTVTTVSVASTNGFAGSVATATSTPVITISTSIIGVLKGDGTSISAATPADLGASKPTALYATTAALSATYNNGTAGVGATLTNTSVTPIGTLDGVAITNGSSGQLILVKDQTAGLENGLYTLTTAGGPGVAWIMTRHATMDVSADFGGAVVAVQQGTAGADTLWLCDTNAPTVGTTAIVFSRLNGGGTNASLLTSGTVATARLGTGTAGSTNFLRGDGAWSIVRNLLVAASDSATVTFDLALSDRQSVTLGGNRTLALSNVVTGQSFTIILKQDGSTRTVTWWSGILWPGGVVPTLTAGGNKSDVFTFICTGSGAYIGLTAGLNI